MLRLFDWECGDCGEVSEQLVSVPHGEMPPMESPLPCAFCGEDTPHARQLSMPARYMGETVLNPIIQGGRFDTAGYAPVPQIPDMPGEADYQERLTRALAANSEHDRTAVMRSMLNDAPSADDYHAHMTKPEVREVLSERKRIAEQNKAKRARLAALKRGEQVNFRKDKLKGDPSIAA